MSGDIVKGQRIYGKYVGPYPANTGGVNGAGGPAGILFPGSPGTFLVTNPIAASDADLANFASLTATSGGGGGGGAGLFSSAYINLNFTGSVTPTAQNAIIFKLTGTDLTRILIQAYNGATAVGTATAVSTLSTTGSGDYLFMPTGACTSIRITMNTAGSGLLGVTNSNSANLYYAYFLDPTCSSTNYTTTNMTGVNLASSFVNPDDAIDGDISTYSSLIAGVGLLTTLNQDIYLSKLTGATDAATITFAIPKAFLSVGVAGYLNITAYNGTTQVGQVTFSSLLQGTDLLALFNSGSPATLSFAPGAPFNRIQISNSNLLGVATTLNIYEVTTTPAKPTFSSPAVQNVTVCAGNPATLTAVPASSGNELRWYTAMMGGTLVNTGNSYTPDPTPTADITTYFVASGKIGCSTESERVPATITVLPLPAITPIAGILTACMGKTTTLSSTPSSGGAWSSATPTVATIDQVSGVVTGVTAGTSVITYTVTGTNGCASKTTAIVTIYALPTVSITGTLTACVGKTTTLSGTPTGGSWSSANTAVATIDPVSGIVTGITAGTSTISYTATNGNGCINTQTATVTIYALPTVNAITGNLSTCIGSTTTLSNMTPLGVWSSASTTIATVNGSGVVTGVAAGTTTINYTVTNSNGCITVISAIVIVHLQPSIPSINQHYLCLGQSVDLNTFNPVDGNGTTGGAYVWSASAGGAALSSTTVSPGLNNTTYYLRYTKDGCFSDSSILITVNPKPPTPHVILN